MKRLLFAKIVAVLFFGTLVPNVFSVSAYWTDWSDCLRE
jgi:hypothetical protein